MRTILISSLIALLAISCGEANTDMETVIQSGDLTQIRELKAKLKGQEKELLQKIEQLDLAINKLDTVETLPLITVERIASEAFAHYIELQGDVKTAKNLTLFPEFSGRIYSMTVDEGSVVRKGQVLARIDDGGLSDQKGQLQVQLDLAKTTFERQARLWEQNIGSEMQYLQAKANYEAQVEALDRMDKQLAKTAITAPFDGAIDEIMSEEGSLASPGQPVMRIVGTGQMYVSIDVPEVHLPNLKEKNQAIVHIPVLGREYESQIKSVGSYINPSNRTFKVEVPLKDRDGLIKPNLNTKVRINDYNAPEAIMIPQNVINEDSNGKEYVYIVKDLNGNTGIAERSYISTGLTREGKIEVKEGLKVNDPLVIEGARSIREGQKVEIDQ